MKDADKSLTYNMIKGISILLVVAIHILYRFHGQEKPALVQAFSYLTGFSVPLFMIIGGFFLTSKLEKLSEFKSLLLILKRLVKRIIIPYYIFVFILIVFRLSTHRPVRIWPLILLLDVNTHGLYFILIYIYAYVISAVTMYALNFFLKGKTTLSLTLIIPCASLVFFPLSVHLLKHYPSNTVFASLTYITYFITGFPLFFLCNKISAMGLKGKIKVFALILLTCFLYTAILYSARFGGWKLTIYSTPPSFFYMIYSVLFFLIIYIVVENVPVLSYIGKKLRVDKFGEQSLWIFLTHPYFMYVLPIIFAILFSGIIKTNAFVLPWFFCTYAVTWLCLQLMKPLPLKIKRIFSR